MSFTSQEIWSRNKEALLGNRADWLSKGYSFDRRWHLADYLPDYWPGDSWLIGLRFCFWKNQNCDYVQSQFGDTGFPIRLCFEPAVLLIAELDWYLGYIILDSQDSGPDSWYTLHQRVMM